RRRHGTCHIATPGGNAAKGARHFPYRVQPHGGRRNRKGRLDTLMFRALYTAASGMTAQQLNLDNVANNLANVSTSGFRKRRLQFTDLLYQNMIMPGSASTSQTTNVAGLQVGLGTKPGASEIVQIQGDFSQTG